VAFPIEQLLFVFLIGTALAVMYLEDLFAAAMIASVFSLLSACLYTVMDAVDVAFTEAAVGAGISTVLILGTLSLTTHRELQQPFRIIPLAVVVLTGAVLIYGTLDMPTYGDADAVIHHHVVPRYIEGSTTEFQIPNIVTNVLAGYRGYDTMGETTVILTATLGVMLLLGAGIRKKAPPAPRGRRTRLTMSHKAVHVVMRDYVILRVVVHTLVPFIMLFAFYVQFHGDFGPGGGFQAGVILGAGLIVYGLILGLEPMQRVAPPTVVEIGLMIGVMLYAGTGIASLFLGGNFLDYAVLKHEPIHGRHLGILLVECGVGITVCCAMTWIFYSFAGRRSVREQTKDRDR
jgi:multicomponent Na+:H+ antiporter subunit B